MRRLCPGRPREAAAQPTSGPDTATMGAPTSTWLSLSTSSAACSTAASSSLTRARGGRRCTRASIATSRPANCPGGRLLQHTQVGQQAGLIESSAGSQPASINGALRAAKSWRLGLQMAAGGA